MARHPINLFWAPPQHILRAHDGLRLATGMPGILAAFNLYPPIDEWANTTRTWEALVLMRLIPMQLLRVLPVIATVQHPIPLVVILPVMFLMVMAGNPCRMLNRQLERTIPGHQITQRFQEVLSAMVVWKGWVYMIVNKCNGLEVKPKYMDGGEGFGVCCAAEHDVLCVRNTLPLLKFKWALGYDP